MSVPKIIVIAGPTASGKSGLAIAVAKALNGVVINADSMQVYQDIPILAAAPSDEDKAIVPHKLYGIYDASVHGNMMDWLNLCRQEITDARQNNLTPIVVGGTGLYLETLQKGASPIPETPKEIRDKVSFMLKQEGLSGLYAMLQKVDESTAARLSANDTTRIRRALEVYYHTKKTMTYWQAQPLKQFYKKEEFINIYINPPREALDNRCRVRFDKMVELGAVDEAKQLLARQLPDYLPAMHALGVQEFKAYFAGKCSLDEAIEQAKLHTRQYAKRQSTWFNNRFSADFCYKSCYATDKNFVEDVKKAL